MAALAAAGDQLAAEDPTRQTDTARAQRLLAWGTLLDRHEGLWLKELAALDAAGAAGADQGVQAPSTASWLRNRLRLSAGAATSYVRTARALFRGPLRRTAQALCDGEVSVAHAQVLAHGTHDLPEQVAAEAEPVLLEAARHLDPLRLRRVLGHLQHVVDPEGADHQTQRRHGRRGLWLAPTWEGMIALQGLLEPEAGQTLVAALEPLARPHSAQDDRSGDQRRADALTELARRNLEGGELPQTGGVRPQLLVTVDLDSLLDQPEVVGGDTGWAGPLGPAACQRLACDSALTRVLISRYPNGHHDHHGDPGDHDHRGGDPHGDHHLADRLQTAMAWLPPILGGAPRQPLDVGRASRVITPTQRAALAVRDGGCVFPECQRPLTWCEGHHLLHWLDGGPTDLDNLALLCRAHHRTIHEGGWQLTRGPDGRFTATPPDRPHQHPPPHRHPRPHRRQPALV
ncbi:MAG TPA: DUF222 domain-containing protein [Actinomycetota bacterium]|jgi:hypothetical protein|nr:DUF222 domain-containing protein [Actinomycetota bacterium]